MVEEALPLFRREVVQPLLLAERTERGNGQHLRFASLEEAGAVRAREDTDVTGERPDLRWRPAVGPDAAVEDRRADGVLNNGVQGSRDIFVAKLVPEALQQLLPARLQATLALAASGRQQSLQVALYRSAHGGLHFGRERLRRELDRLRARLSDDLVLHVQDLLVRLLSELDRLQHRRFRHLERARLHHHHGVAGAGHYQVQFALSQVLVRRVDHQLTVDVADADGADRPGKRRAGDAERRGRANGAEHVRHGLPICGEHRDDHLDIVAEAFREQGPDRPVRQAAGQDRVRARAPFAAEEAARNLPDRIEPLFKVDGQREEVHARPGLIADACRRQKHRIAVAYRHGAAGQPGQLAYLQAQHLASYLSFNSLRHINTYLPLIYLTTGFAQHCPVRRVTLGPTCAAC